MDKMVLHTEGRSLVVHSRHAGSSNTMIQLNPNPEYGGSAAPV